MMAGFLVSRAALSIAMIVFGISTLRDVHPREWLKQKWWLLAVGWVGMYAVSYFWSADAGYWKDRLEVKLPIVLLPLAFSFLPAFSQRQLKIFTGAMAAILLASIGYTAVLVLRDPGFYIQQYDYSQVLPVLAKKDHIRYSLSLSLFVVWCAYYWPRLGSTGMKWYIGLSMLVIVIFLHILAARTGLLALYLFFLVWVLYGGMKKSKWYAAGLLVLMIGGMLAAVTYVPTLKQRIGYVSYSYIMYKKGERSGIYSDIGRIISYDVAGTIIKQHPVAGVGAGDILNEMKTVYRQEFPDVDEAHILLPHNQFLIVMLAGGIPALILFLAWLFAPLGLLRRNRKSIFFLSTWLMLLLVLMVEPALEVQFGVFVYLFFLLWQRHALLHDDDSERNNFNKSLE